MNMDLKVLDEKKGKAIVAAADEVLAGKHRGRVPARGLADGQRHPEQHEHERGPGQPGQRAPGRGAGREAPRPPQRRRQQGAVQQRRLPHRHARGGGRGARERRDPERAPPAQLAAREGRGLCRHREDRAHPPAGRHAPDPGPGVLGLCGPARPRPAAPGGGGAPRVRAGPGRHRGGHGAERPPRVRGAGGREARGADRPALRHRPQQVRGPGQPRRPGPRPRRAQDGGGVPQQDRERRALAGLRAPLRDRRAHHPRERARQLDHARQGQPHPVRGA